MKSSKWFAFLGLAVLVAAFGCGSSSNDDNGGFSSNFASDQDPPPSNSIYMVQGTSGSTFTLDVNVKEITDLYGIGFTLFFDPALVEFVECNEGSFLKDGADTNFFAQSRNPDAVTVGISRIGGAQGKSGDGTLCTIKLKSIGEGVTRIDFGGTHAVNSNGNDLRNLNWVSGTMSFVN